MLAWSARGNACNRFERWPHQIVRCRTLTRGDTRGSGRDRSWRYFRRIRMGAGLLFAVLPMSAVIPLAAWTPAVSAVLLPGRRQERNGADGARCTTSLPSICSKRRRSDCSGTTVAGTTDESRRRCGAVGWQWFPSVPYLSSWVIRAAASSSPLSALRSSPTRIWGSAWFGCGNASGNGGGKNGTSPGLPSGEAMGDGDRGEGREDLSFLGGPGAACSADFAAEAPLSPGPSPWMLLSALWGIYAVWLRQSPILTKALTSGVLGLSGDMAAQCFEHRRKDASGPLLQDTRRLLAVGVDSVFITGPALHALYGAMEYLVPTSGGGFLPAAAHLLVDTFLFDPMFVASFFCVTGVLESRPLRSDVLPSLRREFWPAVRASWGVSLIFCPVQYVTFRYLPLEFRVLSVNACDMVWTSVLSYFSHKDKADPKHLANDGRGAPGMRNRPSGQQAASNGSDVIFWQDADVRRGKRAGRPVLA